MAKKDKANGKGKPASRKALEKLTKIVGLLESKVAALEAALESHRKTTARDIAGLKGGKGRTTTRKSTAAKKTATKSGTKKPRATKSRATKSGATKSGATKPRARKTTPASASASGGNPAATKRASE